MTKSSEVEEEEEICGKKRKTRLDKEKDETG